MSTDIAELGFKVATEALERANQALDQIEKTANRAARGSDKFSEASRRANTATNVLTRAATSLRREMVGLGASLLAAFGARALINNLVQIANNLDVIGKYARKLGETTAGMQSLAVAADMANVEFSRLVPSLSRMTVTIARLERTGKGSEGVFAQIGISASELLAMPLNERLATLADRFEELGLGAEDLLPILSQLGDRGGSLVSLFEGGGDQIRQASEMMERFGGTISDLDVANVEAMNDNFTAIGVAARAMGTQVIAALAPILGPIFAAGAEAVGAIARGIKSLLDGTSSLLPTLREIGAVMLIAFGPMLLLRTLAAVTALTLAMGGDLVKAIWGVVSALAAAALANPFTIILSAISVVLAGFYIFRDKVNEIFGGDFVQSLKGAGNFMIGVFAGAYEASVAVWSQIPAAMGDLTIQAAQAVVDGVEWMINKAISLASYLVKATQAALNPLQFNSIMAGPDPFAQQDLGTIDNPYAGKAAAAGDTIKRSFVDALNVDYIGGVVAVATEAVDSLTGSTEGLGVVADATGGKLEKVSTPLEKITEAIAKMSEPFDQATSAVSAARQALDDGVLTNTKYAETLDRIQRAFMAAGGSALQWGKIIKDNIPSENQSIADAAQRKAEPFDQASAAFNALQSNLNNGIITNDEYAASLLRVQAAFMAAGGSASQWGKITNDVGAQMQDVIKNGIVSFGDELANLAVTGSANFGDLARSIIKDLIRIAIQAWIVKPLLASLFGDGAVIGGGTQFMNTHFAKGAAFFAGGGTFTNTVVDQPTPFMFANGGALGVMGEAGPEAIMPLQRGPDGSLGVQMYGSQSGGGGGVHYEDNSTMVFRIEGAVSEEKIMASIRTAATQAKNDAKKSMPGWLDEYQRNGVMANDD